MDTAFSLADEPPQDDIDYDKRDEYGYKAIKVDGIIHSFWFFAKVIPFLRLNRTKAYKAFIL